MKKILSLPTTPFFVCGFQGLLYFICTIFAHLVDSTINVVWEAGIMFVLCYGFISIHTLLENYFSMTLNNKN
jgi:hypothetical protein